MLIRAFIVLLLVLNLGVAAWWHWSTPAATTTGAELPPNVPRLQLVRERGGAVAGAMTKAGADAATGASAAQPATAAAPSPAATPAPAEAEDTPAEVAAPEGSTPAATATPADAARCYSFGPFDSEESLVAAQATLKPLAEALRVRRPPPRAGRGWRVYLPPVASADEATAVAGRISAAGFRDYFIVREGAEANSVALGRFATEAAARRHAEALTTAGFSVRAEPLGTGAGAAWVDVRVSEDFDAAGVRAQLGAGSLRPVDCATLR